MAAYYSNPFDPFSRLRSNDPTLTELNLSLSFSSGAIGAGGARQLATALATNTTLTKLNLSNNDIGDEGAKWLATALATNTTLTTLDLYNNNISVGGARQLATALATNTTLTKLNLHSNYIGAEGAGRLATVLTINSTLTTLELWNNNIGAEGARRLATALATNTTLTYLEISQNNISFPLLNQIVGLIESAPARKRAAEQQKDRLREEALRKAEEEARQRKAEEEARRRKEEEEARRRKEEEEARRQKEEQRRREEEFQELMRCMLCRFAPPSSTLLEWITTTTTKIQSNLPHHSLLIEFYDDSLKLSLSKWIASQSLLHQSIDQQMACESDFVAHYSDISSLVDMGAKLINLQDDENDDDCELSIEKITSNLQDHIEKLNSIEKQRATFEITPDSLSSSSSSSIFSSEADSLIQRMRAVLVALSQKQEETTLRRDQLSAVPLSVWTQHLDDILQDEAQQPDILAGFEQIHTGIQKSTDKQVEKLTYLGHQLDTALGLVQVIEQLDRETFQKSTLLCETQTSRQQSQRDAIQALRLSISSIASFLILTYQQQLKFVAQDYDDVAKKLKNARSIGLKDVANKLQRRITKIESQMSSIDSKARQIHGNQVQFGLITHDPAVASISTTSPSSSTDPIPQQQQQQQQEPLLIRVQEKERQLMAEAIHSVERVIEYETMVDHIREMNRDLKAKLNQSQQELLDILICPITQEVMVDPVLAADHHTYERQAIELWLRNQSRSPLTNQELPHKQLEPNWMVKNILSKMRELYSIK